MPITRFPDPRRGSYDGIIAVGGDLHPESLLLAYRSGIFPWPMDGLPLPWACPDERAILRFGDLHIPRSLAQSRRRSTLHFSIDRAFPDVINACAAAKRPDQPGTWITREMVNAYIAFHRLGYAHSVEAWDGKELVGGLYGVSVDGVFAGESMFHRQPNASKLALLHLIDHLRDRGVEWIDTQTMTPHFEALGAVLISRDQFLDLLAATRARGLDPFGGAIGIPGA
ncbi:MAG: aat [Chlorobi bacterium]|nr:aat [Chlorobiota bacterium]